MAREKIRHLVTKKNRDGSPRHYWQPSAQLAACGWPTRRLSDHRGTAIGEAEAINDNLDAWRQGEARGPDATPGVVPAPLPGNARPATVGDLIEAFKRHRFFTDKKPKTQAFYDHNFRIVARWAGDLPVMAVTKKSADKLYEKMREKTPAKANAVMTSLRRLYAFADIHYPGIPNPARELGLSTAGRMAGRLWSFDEVDHMIATADAQGWPSVGDAIALAWWLGQRQGDILGLRRAIYRNGTFDIKQAKTGARVDVPHSPLVASRIEAAIARQRAGEIESDFIVLHDTTRQPWLEDTFRHKFAEIREAAEKTMPSCKGLLHRHLRHTAVTNLHSAGCDAFEISSISGHTLAGIEQILDIYFIRTAATAKKAANKRIAWERKERAKAKKGNPQ